jgi:sugar phosphate permease
VGSGLGNVPIMALAAPWFAAPRRGLATGVIAAGSSVGIILVGWVVPGILAVGAEGWRYAWYAYGATTLVVAVAAYAVLRDRPSQKGLPPLGDTIVRPAVKSAADSGLPWKRVYRTRAVWHLGFVYVAFGFSYFLYMTFFTKHLIAAAGYTSARAGGLFMVLGWCSLLSGIAWGAISDRIGRKQTLIVVYLWNAVAFALFGLSHHPLGFAASAVIFGLSAWAVPTIIAASCGDVVGARLAPAALGLATFLFALGQSAGPAVAGMIADSTGGFAPAFLLAAGVSALGAVAAAFLRPAAARSVPVPPVVRSAGAE